MFNEYLIYTQTANDYINNDSGKIFVDLSRLDKLNEFSEVSEMVEIVFGHVDGFKEFKYPKGLLVAVVREEDFILVNAMQKDKQILGATWELRKKEVKNN